MEHIFGPAMVLSIKDIAEADVFLSLFTRDSGKIPALAKSGRKSYKRFCGLLDIMIEMDIAAARKAKTAWYRLDSAGMRQSRPYLHSSPVMLAAGCHLAEVTDSFLGEGQAEPDLYLHLVRTLDEIADSLKLAAALRRYELAIVDYTGHGPMLESCASCNNRIENNGPNFFSFSKGGLLCKQCAPPDAKTLMISSAARQFLLDCRKLSPQDPTPAVESKIFSELRHALPSFLEYQTNRKLKSLEFLRDLIRFKPEG